MISASFSCFLWALRVFSLDHKTRDDVPLATLRAILILCMHAAQLMHRRYAACRQYSNGNESAITNAIATSIWL